MAPARDSLDLLVAEDRAVRSLFGGLQASTGPSVVDVSVHGRLSKDLIQQIAVREAAKDDVVRTLGKAAAGTGLAARMNGRSVERRSTIGRADHLARHMSGMDLPGEFDLAVDHLRQIVEPEIDWELAEGADAARRALSSAGARLRSAQAVRRTAPTSVRTEGAAWYQRLPVVSWLSAQWDQLQDHPTSVRTSGADLPPSPGGPPARPTGQAAERPEPRSADESRRSGL